MFNYDTSSRYELTDDRKEAVRKTKQWAVTGSYSLYTVKQGDTMENIAARQLGDPRRYWEIADVNPQVQFPWDISPGDAIRVPK